MCAGRRGRRTTARRCAGEVGKRWAIRQRCEQRAEMLLLRKINQNSLASYGRASDATKLKLVTIRASGM